jgi:hypothetical protein
MICSTLAALFSGFIPLLCALLPAVGFNSLDIPLIPSQQEQPAIVQEVPLQAQPEIVMSEEPIIPVNPNIPQINVVNINIAGNDNSLDRILPRDKAFYGEQLESSIGKARPI